MAEAIYTKIGKLIIEEIENQKPNSPIESERDLAKKYNISRMTARKAVDMLVDEGYLYRDKNKGTYVADQRLRKKNTVQVTFEPKKNGESHKILFFSVKVAGSEIAQKLETDENELVLRVIRVVMKNLVPTSVEEISVARKKIPNYVMKNISVLFNFNEYFDIGLITQRFIPMLVPVQYANILRLKLNTPIIAIENTIFSKNGEPLIYIKVFNNPNKVIEITS